MQVLCEIKHYYIFYCQLSPPLYCEQEGVFTNKQYRLDCRTSIKMDSPPCGGTIANTVRVFTAIVTFTLWVWVEILHARREVMLSIISENSNTFRASSLGYFIHRHTIVHIYGYVWQEYYMAWKVNLYRNQSFNLDDIHMIKKFEKQLFCGATYPYVYQQIYSL